MCFSRVVWGIGPFPFDNDLRMMLRRFIGDFSRVFVKTIFNISTMSSNFHEKKNKMKNMKYNVRKTSFNSSLRGKKLVKKRVKQLRFVKSNISKIHRQLNSINVTDANHNNEVVLLKSDNNIFRIDNKPINIVLYSRGYKGLGRSIANERYLISKLQSYGATAVICCDYIHMSLEEQIAYAYHADVVR